MKKEYIAIVDRDGLDCLQPFSGANAQFMALRMRFNTPRDPQGYRMWLDEKALADLQANWPGTRETAIARLKALCREPEISQLDF